MKIYRDGKEIELTWEECRQAYNELDKEYKAEDLRGKLEDMEIELEVTDKLIERFDHALGNNDGYWESYWLTAEYVIEEYVREMEGK